jgi:MFS family permease
MNEKTKSNFLIFWIGQAISQLGSSITRFALVIWVFNQTGSAMSVSLVTLSSYLPYILASILSGDVVDKLSKKTVLIVSDTIAAFCTINIVLCVYADVLSVWQIYVVSAIIGLTNAFQSPAAAVVTGMLVPGGRYDKASGLNSFSNNLVMIVAPMLAGIFVAFAGLKIVLLIDFSTFLFAAISLLFFVNIKESLESDIKKPSRWLDGFREGFGFFIKQKGILHIMLSMALINFFSRLTYENILAPMILSRSGGNSTIYGIVSGVLGIGGVIGGFLVLIRKKKANPLKLIYFSAAFSFLFGDLLMGVGRDLWIWCIAGLAASIPIPFVLAGQNMILYRTIPRQMQGRMFAVRNAIQFSTVPIGIFLGGFLAEYVFEPFMSSSHIFAIALGKIVGSGKGSGMAVMFLCTGVLGVVFSWLGYRDKDIRNLEDKT